KLGERLRGGAARVRGGGGRRPGNPTRGSAYRARGGTVRDDRPAVDGRIVPELCATRRGTGRGGSRETPPRAPRAAGRAGGAGRGLDGVATGSGLRIRTGRLCRRGPGESRHVPVRLPGERRVD